MRFFSLRHDPPSRVVLVESGSRELLAGPIKYFQSWYGDRTQFDVVTCYAGLPPGLSPENATLYPIHLYRGRQGRRRLYEALRAGSPSDMVMICSGEPIMAKWKWALALHLPVKVLVVNENGDFFWFDRSNLDIIFRLLATRTGLSGTDAPRTLLSFLLFPLTFCYLVAYALFVHLRRKVLT